MQKAAKAYLQTQITTTTQNDILILLYDGAIKFLRQAKDKIAARDYAGKGILISKASAVIDELQSSLNKDKGGDLAENLSRLYFYCNTRLLMANLKMDPAILDQVIGILSSLRAAYAEIIYGDGDGDGAGDASQAAPQPPRTPPLFAPGLSMPGLKPPTAQPAPAQAKPATPAQPQAARPTTQPQRPAQPATPPPAPAQAKTAPAAPEAQPAPEQPAPPVTARQSMQRRAAAAYGRN